jgi:hypothetical protein
MLAAMPAEDDRILEMFRLALCLVSHNQSAPDQLKTYFAKVLAQARSLSKDPKSVDEQLMPEAIQLAVELDMLKDLRTAIAGVTELSALSATKAATILESMEHDIASES